MLRALLVLLLAANLVYLGWWRGWLPVDWLPLPHGESSQREPARLLAQLRPDSIEVLDAAGAQRLATVRCLQAGPFDDGVWPRAEAAVAGAGLAAGDWQWVPADAPASGAWLRVPEADAGQQAQLQAIDASTLGHAFTLCP